MFANCRHDVHKQKVERFDSRLMIIPRYSCDSAWYNRREFERCYDLQWTFVRCYYPHLHNERYAELINAGTHSFPLYSSLYFFSPTFHQEVTTLCMMEPIYSIYGTFFQIFFFSLFYLLVFNFCAYNYCGIINWLIF